MELDKCFFNSTEAECSFSKGQMTPIPPDDFTKAIISKISKTSYAVSRCHGTGITLRFACLRAVKILISFGGSWYSTHYRTFTASPEGGLDGLSRAVLCKWNGAHRIHPEVAETARESCSRSLAVAHADRVRICIFLWPRKSTAT